MNPQPEADVGVLKILDFSGGVMIFAITTDERTLYAFSSMAEVSSYCEGLDVEAAEWLFWDDKGRPLSPRFTVRNKRGWFAVKNGEYHLELADDLHHAHLNEVLDEIVNFSSTTKFSTASEVRSYITKSTRNGVLG